MLNDWREAGQHGSNSDGLKQEPASEALHADVIYPGLTEFEDERDRRANGIPLHKEVVEWFEGITEELSTPALVKA